MSSAVLCDSGVRDRCLLSRLHTNVSDCGQAGGQRMSRGPAELLPQEQQTPLVLLLLFLNIPCWHVHIQGQSGPKWAQLVSYICSLQTLEERSGGAH